MARRNSKFDSIRNTLLSKVTNPLQQLELITVAIIYKLIFIENDQLIRLSSKSLLVRQESSEKYHWDNLSDNSISGPDKLLLFKEGIKYLYENIEDKYFRTVLNNAEIPLDDPETFNKFVKEVNKLNLDHPEALGDAYEELLSTLRTSGDLGQFRTPRHLIDFIVEVVGPNKTDSILDPACGTAGFLISSYKFIKENNSELSASEVKKFTESLSGYDIELGMVKLASVNLRLHQIKTQQIFEYDPLTKDTRWDDKFDVVLANPPFMTPKGGIVPHGKYSLDTKRVEALFVEYILRHLNPSGKGAIIVPDGIVNNKSFTELRKEMLSNGLYCVVSLHEYSFKPYAGAKTCVLFFDKKIENNQNILHIEIENDGFKKGANRDIKIKENDLLDAQFLIEDFKNNIENTNLSKFTINSKIQDYSSEGLDIKKLYHHKNNLTLCPYTIIYENSLEPNSKNLIRLGDVFDIHKGTLQSTKSEPGEYRFITASSDKFYHENYDENLTGPSIIIATGAGGSLGKVQFFNGKFIASDLCHVLKQKSNTELDLYFYFYYFKKYKSLIEKVAAKGVSKRAINQTNLANLRIHTFSLEEQQRVGKIVKENLNKLDKLNQSIKTIEDETLKLIS